MIHNYMRYYNEHPTRSDQYFLPLHQGKQDFLFSANIFNCGRSCAELST